MKKDLVLLVHGMARTARSMSRLARALERSGYEPVMFPYPSHKVTVASTGRALLERMLALSKEDKDLKIHLVGHSLGGIIIRWAIAQTRVPALGRVLLVAPPNQGSDHADRYERTWLSRLLHPLAELTTRADSTTRSIPTPKGVVIGVIAGDRDSKVTIAQTHLQGETAHVVVSSGHTFIMARRIVHRLIVRFLDTGSFDLGQS